MPQKYTVRQWLKQNEQTGLPCNATVEMTLAQMLKTDHSKISFYSVTVGDCVIHSEFTGTDNLAIVAKALIEPFEQGKLKYPLSVYLSALRDECHFWTLDSHGVGDSPELEEGSNNFNIHSVRAWVEQYLVMFTVGSPCDILETFIEHRVDHAVSEIKKNVGEAMADFVERMIDKEYVYELYSDEDKFVQTADSSRLDGKETKALFRFELDEEDELFKAIENYL